MSDWSGFCVACIGRCGGSVHPSASATPWPLPVTSKSRATFSRYCAKAAVSKDRFYGRLLFPPKRREARMMSGEYSIGVDWTKDATYDYTAKLADRSWAWEWLRRNPDFRAAWDDGRLQYGIAGYDASTTLLVAQTETPRISEWGCL